MMRFMFTSLCAVFCEADAGFICGDEAKGLEVQFKIRQSSGVENLF